MRSLILKLLNWLSGRLSSADSLEIDYYDLDLKTGTTTKARGTVESRLGLHLVIIGEQGSRKLIDASKAVNRDQFVRIWKRMAGPIKVTWEDGSPVDLYQF